MKRQNKYDRRSIMRRGWFLVKRMSYTFSDALKRAWAEAKALKSPEAIQRSYDIIKALLTKSVCVKDAFGFQYQI